MAAWWACPGAAEVEEGRGRTVEAGGVRVTVFRDGDRYHALSSRCPHAGAPMGGGWVEEGEAVCPLHRWRFRLKDGRCSTVKREWLARYECEVRGGEVWVKV